MTPRDKMLRMADLLTCAANFPDAVLEMTVVSGGKKYRLDGEDIINWAASHAFDFRLAPPVIPDEWWIAHPDAKWCAVDRDWAAFFYITKPKPRVDGWLNSMKCGSMVYTGHNLPHPRPDWRSELYQRPKHLKKGKK